MTLETTEEDRADFLSWADTDWCAPAPERNSKRIIVSLCRDIDALQASLAEAERERDALAKVHAARIDWKPLKCGCVVDELIFGDLGVTYMVRHCTFHREAAQRTADLAAALRERSNELHELQHETYPAASSDYNSCQQEPCKTDRKLLGEEIQDE